MFGPWNLRKERRALLYRLAVRSARGVARGIIEIFDNKFRIWKNKSNFFSQCYPPGYPWISSKSTAGLSALAIANLHTNTIYIHISCI